MLPPYTLVTNTEARLCGEHARANRKERNSGAKVQLPTWEQELPRHCIGKAGVAASEDFGDANGNACRPSHPPLQGVASFADVNWEPPGDETGNREERRRGQTEMRRERGRNVGTGGGGSRMTGGDEDWGGEEVQEGSSITNGRQGAVVSPSLR
jgi:hypothetical protein